MELEEIKARLSELIANFDYSRQSHYADRMSVHAQGNTRDKRGHFFDFILTSHLFEDEIVTKWRQDNFVAITVTGFNRGFNTLSRIFRDSEFITEVSDALETYLTKAKFKGTNFYTFASTYLMRCMVEDPNSFIAILPVLANINNPSDRVGLEIINIPSQDVKYFDETTLIWQPNYGYNKKGVYSNEYFVLTDNSFIRLYKVNATAKGYKEELIYNHSVGSLPAFLAGGDWSQEGMYKSFFDGYIHFGFEALKQYSDYSFVVSKAAHPIREVADIPCDAEGCTRGVVYKHDPITGQETQHTCRKCNGSGRLDLSGPSNTLIRPTVGVGGEIDNRPLIVYHSPPTDILVFMRECFELSLRKAEQALQLNFVEEAQSGVAKAMDRDEHRAFLMRIAINYYDNIMWNCLSIMENYINPNIRQVPQVAKPQDFNTNNEDSLEEEIKVFTAAGLNNLAAVSMDKLIPKKSGGNKILEKKLEFIRWFDPLNSYSIEQKRADYFAKTVKSETYYNSLFVNNAVDKVLYNKGSEWFLDAEFSIIQTEIMPILEASYPEDEEDITDDTLDNNDNNNFN